MVMLTHSARVDEGMMLVATSKEYTDMMGKNSFGGTYGGNAVAMAACNGTLEVR